MPIIQLLVVLIVLGVVWWLVQTYLLPHVAEPFRTLIVVLVVIVACLWLLSLVGLVPMGVVRWG
jgi:hypothetical protein